VSKTQCPKCNVDIGLASVMKAMFPNRIMCPHCGTRLTYKPVPWLMIIICAFIYTLFLILVLSHTSNLELPNIFMNLAVNMVLVFLIWQPFDYLITRHLIRSCQLSIYEKAKNV